MPIFILSILVQVAMVVHIVKTGRNTLWIWIVVMLPMAGSIAYFIVEVLPTMSQSASANKAKAKVIGTINPHKGLKLAQRNYQMTDTIDNATRLAEELYQQGQFEAAKDLYLKSLSGPHEYDPYLMQGLAFCEFKLGNFEQTKICLDQLIEHNPDHKNPEAHLLYAKTLEKLNDISAALHEYQALDQYYTGPEASYRYAMLLKAQGKSDRSMQIINQILKDANYSGKHYHSLYKHWIKKAKAEAK
ncbi:MAG: tetratricopeptide repeat protein [Enterobacterales bacterium]|nr:tetratricopeptide repeat protein [Enterobacterales bacterium]